MESAYRRRSGGGFGTGRAWSEGVPAVCGGWRRASTVCPAPHIPAARHPSRLLWLAHLTEQQRLVHVRGGRERGGQGSVRRRHHLRARVERRGEPRPTAMNKLRIVRLGIGAR